MTQKRYYNIITTGDIKDELTGELLKGSAIGDRLNEQHETIQDMKFFITNLEAQRDEFYRGARENGVAYRKYEEKVKDTLQKHYDIVKK